MVVMEVQSWSGDWNLLSIDIRCLEVLVRKLVQVIISILILFLNLFNLPFRRTLNSLVVRSKLIDATILGRSPAGKLSVQQNIQLVVSLYKQK